MRLKSHDILFIIFNLSIVFIYFKHFSLNVDSSWILYVASQILEGKTLYTEISEVNPPLIFVYSLIPVLFSKLFMFSYDYAYIVMVCFLVLISTYLSFCILKKTTLQENQIRLYLYVIITILTIGSYGDFGEREHLLVLFILPYVIYSMFKTQITISRKLLGVIALFAVFGLNLKPHFFLIFFVIEFIYIVYLRSLKNFFRWDSFLIIFSGLFYIGATMVFFPEYINFALPMAVKTYITIFNKSLATMLYNYEILIFLLTCMVWLFFIKRRFSLDNMVLLSTIVGFLIIYLIQQKGWFYHRLPLLNFTYLFLAHMVIVYIQKAKVLFLIVLFPLLTISVEDKFIKTNMFVKLENIVESLPDDAKVHIISFDIARGQALLKEGQVWSSRFGALGILSYIRKSNDPDIKKYLLDAFYDDLIEKKPDYIIFCERYSTFEYYEFFITEDNRLKKIYENDYTKSIIDEYIVLEKLKKE